MRIAGMDALPDREVQSKISGQNGAQMLITARPSGRPSELPSWSRRRLVRQMYQRLQEEPFELLLTDIVMPEMDGIELTRRACELDPDIKIMFITGFAAVELNSDTAAPKNAK